MLDTRLATRLLIRVAVFLPYVCSGMASSAAIAQAAPIPTPPPAVSSLRAIPDDNLAYPVFVVAGNSRGSGFYMNAGNGGIFFITAKHVLFDPATKQLYAPTAALISYSKDLKDTTLNVMNLDFAKLQSKGNLRSHPSQDVVAIKVLDGSPQAPMEGGFSAAAEGVTITAMAKTGFLTVSIKNVKTFDQVLQAMT
jgi:hypothetical protein